jgi:hypothetical protein
MIMIPLVFLSGIMLSVTAAYYSIVGLIAIFPGETVAIIAMGATLEIGKLVAASWLYKNWKTAPVLLKTYMVIAVAMLMFITSMGIFGFLSKAHLEHTATTTSDTSYELQTVNDTIASREKSIALIERQLNNIDRSLERYLDGGNVAVGLAQKRRLDGERKALETERKSVEVELVELKGQRNKLSAEVQKQEVEVGPLKYIAELVYGEEDAKSHFDSAVRGVIILLIMVFDPLAVVLLLAANASMTVNSVDIKPKRKYTRRKPIASHTIEDVMYVTT